MKFFIQSATMATESRRRNIMFQIGSPALIECFLKNIENCLTCMRRDCMRRSRWTQYTTFMKFSFFIRIECIMAVIISVGIGELRLEIFQIYAKKKPMVERRTEDVRSVSYLLLHSNRIWDYHLDLIHHNTMLDRISEWWRGKRWGEVGIENRDSFQWYSLVMTD